MKNTADSEQMRPLEKSFLALESFPWGAIYRLVIGFLAPAAASLLLGDDGSGWALVPFLVGALLALRVVPALFRKMMPFSDAAREVWAERRQMAKRYDSYQWRKLFWIGVGLALYTALSGKFSTSRLVACCTCLVTGAFGLARWRVVAPRGPAAIPTKPKSELA